ncbi:universal stress protein [Microvirga subterranea]|uniref:Universal stress protein family protein n=1 Tax=Microvirga subterranea TaxID=186651 RepID=A0A370HRK0_9HYPH|nr:universal stress protein [Microvirga subterranea]RDI61138.1 universal stress protein family protein [Microvirga subterranea]
MPLSNVKNILVGFTEEEERPSSALSYGLSLARDAGAHVTALSASVKLMMAHAIVSEMAAGLVASENKRVRALAEAAAETARQRALSEGVPCTVETVQLHYAELVETFATLCRVHDLSIVDADADLLTVDRSFIEQALFSSGRPVIVVPHGKDTFKADRIMVAWDGSAKAARALNDALPFLQNAKTVELVCVTGEKDLSKAVPGAEIAPHLVRHGIQPSLTELSAKNGDAAETLRNHAVLTRADMIVMGAFVHSRLRQTVFGGVTQSMLKNAPAPLYLSY